MIRLIINSSLKTISLFLLVAGLVSSAPTRAKADTVLPPSFTTEAVVSGLQLPMAVAWTPDGRMFIAQKGGQVRVFRNGTLLPGNFIDLSAQVNHFADHGLLGIAVHPNFPATPYVYLLFTYDPPGVESDGGGERVSRLMRVSASPSNLDVALPGSEMILLGKNSILENIGDPKLKNGVFAQGLSGPPSCDINGKPIEDCLASDTQTHSIGTVRFGIDGSLFVGNGEGASAQYLDVRALRAQDLDSLGGKVLRIDPITGDGYADNPFYDGDPKHNRSKVWNYGMRNPFRFTINPVSGEVFIGDVGWANWEEANTGRGKNFGWPCYEGNDKRSARQSNYQSSPDTQAACAQLYSKGSSAVQAPLYSFYHSTESGAAIVMGDFYVGATYPAQYRGGLFFTDFVNGWIKYLSFDRSGRATLNDFGTDLAGSGGGGVVQIIGGPDTNLYYVTIGGEVRRIRYTAGTNASPIARIVATLTEGVPPLKVAFSGVGSADPDAETLKYQWTFGDGGQSNEPNPSYTYRTPGSYAATLTVTDSQGISTQASVNVTVKSTPPVSVIETPAKGGRYRIGDTIALRGAGRDLEDGALSGEQLRWTAALRGNDAVGPAFFSAAGAEASFSVPDHPDDVRLEVCLTATDKSSQTGETCVTLVPNTVKYTFMTQPNGLRLSYQGVVYKTPFTVETIINALRRVVAPVKDGRYGLVFRSWSDGGSANRLLTVGQSPKTYTALYTDDGATSP